MYPKNPARAFQSISRVGLRIIFCNDRETFIHWTKTLTRSRLPFRTYALTIEIPEPWSI